MSNFLDMHAATMCLLKGENVMYFYKFICSIKSKSENDDFDVDKIAYNKFCEDMRCLKLFFFIVENQKSNLIVDAVCNGSSEELENLDEYVRGLLRSIQKDFDKIEKEEITYHTLNIDLEVAFQNKFIKDIMEFRRRLNVDIDHPRAFSETLVDKKPFDESMAMKKCQELAVNQQVQEEFKRIYAPRTNNSFGVPVHYIVDMDYRNGVETIEALVNALHFNGRMLRDKFATIKLNLLKHYDFNLFSDISKIFEMNEGGVVVINSPFDIDETDKYCEELDVLKDVCQVAYYNANSTTIIFHSTSSKRGQLNFIKNQMGSYTLIEMHNRCLSGETAKNYLFKCAKENHIKEPLGLESLIEEGRTYEMFELSKMFKEWQQTFVKTVQFPQYGQFVEKAKEEIEKQDTHLGYNDLKNLIGLENVKKIINNFINYEKLQRACELQGKKTSQVCRHMCFVGNPGTAKTTVARIVAQIMKEEGLLSKGELIEVGRADIVSKYLGGTAPKVKELFKRAVGNILFIDEAYSLCEGKEGLYGDESINAIVQEMENNRENVIVIFAGYKKEMQNFLDKNSGLRSRIAFEVEFPDYSEEELFEIARYQAQNMDVDISRCEDKIKEIIFKSKKLKNFGNGRFIRNLLEKSRMQQATRLVNENKLNTQEIGFLIPEDLVCPIETDEKLSIGFRF